MSNEITVKLKCNITEIEQILKDKNFTITKYYLLDDTYYIPQNIDVNALSVREILNKAILLRNIEEHFEGMQIKKYIKLTCKKKKFAENGDIIYQSKSECEVTNIEEARNFIESIGYKKIMNIKENGTIFTNGELEINLKDIINGDQLIEVETNKNNKKFDTIDKLKEEIDKLKIPIDTSDYFVKKAEIELEKVLK